MRARIEAPVLATAVVVAVLLALAALTSDAADWEPAGLVVALAVLLVVADLAVVSSRTLRMSSSLMVQTTAMALLGPAPAVAIGALSIVIVDGVIYRLDGPRVLSNVLLVAGLGLVGGVLFELLGAALGLTPDDAAFALLVLPVYAILVAVNLGLLVLTNPNVGRPTRTRVRNVRQSSLPLLSLELVNGLFAATAVLLWAQSGLVAAAGLLGVLVLVIPLMRKVTDLLTESDDLVTLRDERAADVARLASDRARLLSEVVGAEERERARLAESLHDGPMQHLMALRQEAAETGAELAGLDAAIAETRAIISAFHPWTVRELGFEGSLRAAIAPFPAARAVVMTVDGTADDQPLLLRIAQELVVNAVKHARPKRIDVVVTSDDGHLVLEVSDDGIGIDTPARDGGAQAGHIGLAMVRRRVEDAGGRFEIATRADGGTSSRIVLPAHRRPM